MDMDNTVDAVKKYWPWALGALAGLWLLTRFSGGGAVDDSGSTAGSLYDPSLLANNLAMTQLASETQQAQIAADASNNLAGWGAISTGFQALANINQDFQSGQIAAYGAQKEISVNAANVMGNVSAAGMLAAAETSSNFFNMIGESTKSAASIVDSVSSANVQSQQALGNVFTRVVIPRRF